MENIENKAGTEYKITRMDKIPLVGLVNTVVKIARSKPSILDSPKWMKYTVCQATALGATAIIAYQAIN